MIHIEKIYDFEVTCDGDTDSFHIYISGNTVGEAYSKLEERNNAMFDKKSWLYPVKNPTIAIDFCLM